MRLRRERTATRVGGPCSAPILRQTSEGVPVLRGLWQVLRGPGSVRRRTPTRRRRHRRLGTWARFLRRRAVVRQPFLEHHSVSKEGRKVTHASRVHGRRRGEVGV